MALRSTCLVGLAFASLGIVAAACGSDAEPTEPGLADGGGSSGAATTSSSGAARAPVPKDQFYEQLAAAMCDGLEACCDNAGYPFEPGACTAFLADAGRNPTSAGVLDDPTLTYDPVAAAACVELTRASNALCTVASTADRAAMARAQLAALGTAGADPTAASSCSRVLSGTKQVGEPCTLGQCALPPAGSQMICAPLPDAPNDAPAVCQIIILVTEAGAPCDDPTDRGATFRFCTTPPDVSAAALPSTDAEYAQVLEDSLYCVEGACKRIGDFVGRIGQACGYENTCEESADCVDGTCRARAQVNESCETVGCVRTAACDPGTRTCKARLADGAACVDNQDCLGSCNERGVCAPEFSGAATKERCGGTTDAQ